jgi:hypothetical protein
MSVSAVATRNAAQGTNEAAAADHGRPKGSVCVEDAIVIETMHRYSVRSLRVRPHLGLGRAQGDGKPLGLAELSPEVLTACRHATSMQPDVAGHRSER